MLLGLGVSLTITVVPGVFTVDDNNYLVNVLALRQGRVTIASTDGLPPSRELLFFDPAPWSRAVDSTPVASTAPPRYAPIALPFSFFGWRGLVALNTLAYLATIVMVFVYARRYASEALTPWLAAAAFGLGGYVIEYAQGVWPHALSIALCTAGILAAARVVENGRVSLAVAAGLLLGLATGVRYQNAVLLAAVGAGIVLWAWRRRHVVAAFVLAAAVPLSLNAVINHVRLDSWNPISKGPGYLNVPLMQSSGSSLLDPLVMLWARVVDFSVRPPLIGPFVESWVTYDATTGAHLMLGITLKKALLQSAPWVVLALMLFALAWTTWLQVPVPRRRQLRLLSLPFLAILGVFAVAGARPDGLSFNERYLLELLPLAAVTFAWALDGRGLRLRPLLIGGVVGAALVLLILLGTPILGGPETPLWRARQLALFKVPLVLAGALGALWILDRARYDTRWLLSGAVGVCLGWGLMLHMADDLTASRRLRALNLARTGMMAGLLTDGSALVAHWGNKDAAVPLLFDRDIVILDAHADGGEDAPVLIRALLGEDHRVLLLEDGFPPSMLERVLSGLEAIPLEHQGLGLFELHLASGQR
jgi:hypothetical protein